MVNLLARFRTADVETDPEPDWEKLRELSSHPDLIGKNVAADKNTPFFMRCVCGMLVMTTRELSCEPTTCTGCMNEKAESAATALDPPLSHARHRPRGEARVLFGLVVFVLITAGYLGPRVWNAPSRGADTHQLD